MHALNLPLHPPGGGQEVDYWCPIPNSDRRLAIPAFRPLECSPPRRLTGWILFVYSSSNLEPCRVSCRYCHCSACRPDELRGVLEVRELVQLLYRAGHEGLVVACHLVESLEHRDEHRLLGFESCVAPEVRVPPCLGLLADLILVLQPVPDRVRLGDLECRLQESVLFAVRARVCVRAPRARAVWPRGAQLLYMYGMPAVS